MLAKIHSRAQAGIDAPAVTVPHRPRLATDDLSTLRTAALDGIGIAEIPQELIHQDLEAGGLIRVLPDYVSLEGIVHAVYPTRRGMVPAVASLVDTLAAEFPTFWSERR